MNFRRDSFRQKRGGTSKLLIVSCTACKAAVLSYQKDGIGDLLRCYLNRIAAPPALAALQHSAQKKSDLTPLICPECKAVMGVPMLHSDGRLAFRLVPGSFSRAEQH
jgi:hypothetical protein